MERITVPVILGPTAAGKSDLALRAAEEFGYEILSCDSRQIYRHMDIGTAKPPAGERARVRHWLVDVLDPSEPYSAFAFAGDALRIIRESHENGKKILICGGTGLYYNVLAAGAGAGALDGADPELRGRLTAEARELGSAALHGRLLEADPAAAARIHPNDLQRLLRALDVYYSKGQTLTSLQEGSGLSPEDIDFHVAIVTRPREELYGRINRRVDAMLGQGLWEEFRSLRRMGYTAESPGMACVGYRELFDVESGAAGLDRAAEQIRQNTRRYAKRQMTWFRNKVRGVGIDASDEAAAGRQVREWIAGMGAGAPCK